MPGKPSHKSPINYLLDAVSVCLLLISLAALFFAVGKSGRAKTEPELAKASAGDCKRYVTRNIEDIRIGERTLGTNPQGRLESELDESVFQTVPHCGYSLRYTAENGSRCDIRLLRPADWLDWELTRLCRASDGKAVDTIDLVSEDLASGGFDIGPDYELETWLELPEMGVVGWARVTDVDADVEIEQGAGNIVTGVFAHTATSTLDLTVEGQTAPIGCTANHPFWSVDRQEFVSAGELREGERLALYSGETKRVVQKLPRPGPEVVYNLEVYGEHAYCVSPGGVLVHNACTHNHHVVMKGNFSHWRPENRQYVTGAQDILKRYDINVNSRRNIAENIMNEGHSVRYAEKVYRELSEFENYCNRLGLSHDQTRVRIARKLSYMRDSIVKAGGIVAWTNK